MILRLVIDNFGKFRGRSFDFGPVTLFSGRNEAGKTSLFDALFDALCSPRGNNDPARRLRARYGQDRKARLEFQGEEYAIPAPDFLNLFAIRAGDLSLEIGSNSEWMNRVKANLFSGGIDPREVVRALEEDLTSTARGRLAREERDLAAELRDLRLRLDRDRAEREACLAEERRVQDLDRRRRADEEMSAALAGEVAELEKSLRGQRVIRELRTLREAASRPGERRRLEADLVRLRRFTPDGLDSLRGTEERIKRLGEEKEKIRAALEAAEDGFRRHLEEKTRGEEERDRLERARALAEALKASLGDRERLVERKTVTVLRVPLLAAALLFLGAGLASFFLLPREYAAGSLVAGVSLFAAAGAFAFHRETREDTRRFDGALAQAAWRWEAETGESWKGLGYEAILVALDRAAEKAVSAAEKFRALRDAAAAAEGRQASLGAAFRKADGEHQETIREARSFLDGAGAADLAEYAQGLVLRRQGEERLAGVDRLLREGRDKYGASTDDELEALLMRRAEDLGREAADRELSDGEVRALESRLRERKTELDGLQATERSALGDVSLKLGAVRERFRGLPERISQGERETAWMELRLREIGLEKKAIDIARSIYSSLAEDGDVMLGELSREISGFFSRFVAEERTVGLGSFSLTVAKIQDGEGGRREGELLSSGTRDAFLLAARLALARKSAPPDGRALVVLDEPFMALDRPRTSRALEALKDFHRETGWQIVLFSKDETLEKQAQEIFGGLLRVNRL